MTTPLSTLLTVLEQLRRSLAEQSGPDGAEACLELMRELVNRLPHNNLLAATRAEIQAAGAVMMREGYSLDEMRGLQAALASFLDLAVAARLVEANVVRSKQAVAPGAAVAAGGAVLVVGFPAEAISHLRGLLHGEDLDVVGQPSGPAALEAARWYPFRILLCAYPLRGMDIGAFLAEVRGERSLCRHAGLILLTSPAAKDDAAVLVGRGANRVISLDAASRELKDTVAALEGISRRTEVRITVLLSPPDEQRWESFQSVNLSETGILVRTPKVIAKGTEVDLELVLPSEPGLPIRVRGEVVRATSPTRERVRGLAVRFLSFQRSDKYRYDVFLRRSAAG